MAGKGPGIYFNRKTKEVVSINGHQEHLDLKGWLRVSDDSNLRLLAVRKLLRERRLVRDETRVYWSGFRVSSSNGAIGLPLSDNVARTRVREASGHRRGGALASAWAALRRLVRSVFRLRGAH